MAATATAPAMPAGYPARRTQNWMIIGLLYSFFYMSRYNFTALSPQLMNVFGWTKVDLSFLETAMPFLYGISVLVNAAIADIDRRLLKESLRLLA